jgi:tether containing UBX domain for GLUT4
MGRNVQIYAAPTSGTPQAARRAFNEGDYVPTIEHAKIHQAALQAKTRNQRLPSDKELAEQENARLEKLKAVAEKGSSVRIRFPDQMMIQTSVSKDDTAETLYSFVEGFLEYKEPFQLRYLSPTNGRQVPIARDQKRLIQDLRFTAAELVTFVWDEAASAEARLSRKTLAKEWQDKAETLEVREPVVEENTAPAPQQTKAEGKKKSDTGGADKESKLKNILSKGLFKR